MKTITLITSVQVDYPGAGQITLVGTYASQTFTQPSQATTVGEFPANPNWSRGHRLTNVAHFILRNGANSVAFLISALSTIAIALETSLSWTPLITAQPGSVTATGSASATGTLTGSGSTNVADNDTVTIGTTVYRFKNTIAQLNDVHIAGSGNSDASLDNLIAAIMGTGTPGTDYFTGTPVNTQVTAAARVSHAFTVTAIASGLGSNAIATTKSSSVVSWGNTTLTGGTDHTANFSVTAGATETPLSYQWQYLNGSTWTNISSGSPINGCVYSNYTTAMMTCAPTTTGQNNVAHRCVVTNSSGSTNTNGKSVLIIT